MSDTASQVDERHRGAAAAILRLLLSVAFLITLWATSKGMDRWSLEAKMNLTYSLGGWLPWMAGSVLAGLFFGFACWMPRRIAFRATTAIALGVIPFLGMINMPAYLNFSWWPYALVRSFDSMNSVIFFGCLLGIAIAAGFGDGALRQSGPTLRASEPGPLYGTRPQA